MTTNTEKSGEKISVRLFDELVLLAKRRFASGRRFERRFPLFLSVSVQVGQRTYSAFTREISDSGMGLLHNMEMPLEEVLVTIPNRQERLRLRIEWCDPVGEGWYISGGQRTDGVA